MPPKMANFPDPIDAYGQDRLKAILLPSYGARILLLYNEIHFSLQGLYPASLQGFLVAIWSIYITNPGTSILFFFFFSTFSKVKKNYH